MSGTLVKLSTIIDILNDNYTLKTMSGMMSSVKKFVKANQVLCKKQGIRQELLNTTTWDKGNKTKKLERLAIPFLDKKLFGAFRDSLPSDIRRIMDELIWEGQMTHENVEERLKICIYDENHHTYHTGYSRTSYRIKPKFKFFPYKELDSYYYMNKADITLYFSPGLCRLIHPYYEKPEEATFNPVEEPDVTEFVFLGEENILMEMPRILIYEKQGNVKITTKGKPQANSLGKMQRKLNLREFYPAEGEFKALKTIRTNLLAGLIATKPKISKISQTPDLLSKLFLNNYQKNYYNVQCILGYFKGAAHIYPYEEYEVNPSILAILSMLPTGKWIGIKNMESFIKYNQYYVSPISKYIASDKLYYSKIVQGKHYKYDDKKYIDSGLYREAVLESFIKGTCFLFAAYGLIDIAYDTPNMDDFGEKVYSPYDGLKYIRLNALGAYIFGKTQSYDAPVSKSTISLSDDSLTITIDEKDTTAAIILEPYTERVSPKRFRTNSGLFLKDVKNKSDLENKIGMFKQSFEQELPQNWQNFFKELLQKIDPLNKVSNLIVFHVPPDNKELLRLIAKDSKLQDLCLKAEGYHVILTKKNLPKFKNRLREFGYLIT